MTRRKRHLTSDFVFHEVDERQQARHTSHAPIFSGRPQRAGQDSPTCSATSFGRGRIEYHSTSIRYVLNGGLLEEVKLALRGLAL
jgi:hypothetical protein